MFCRLLVFVFCLISMCLVMLCLQVLVNGADSFSRFLFAFSTLFLHVGLVLVLNAGRVVRISQSQQHSIVFFMVHMCCIFALKKQCLHRFEFAEFACFFVFQHIFVYSAFAMDI